MKTLKTSLFISVAVLLAQSNVTLAQTLFVPNGTSGIGSSSNTNVGIGTTATPAQKLDVNGNIVLGNPAGSTPGSSGILNFRRPGDGLVPVTMGMFTNNEFSFRQQGGGSYFTFWTNGGNVSGYNEKMRIDNNGNIGIGTTTPVAPFHVKGSGQGAHTIIETDASGEGDLQWFQGGTAASNQRAVLQVSMADGSFEGWTFDGNSWGVPWLHVNRSTRNVGIGTTTPTAPFHVKSSGQGAHMIIETDQTGEGDLQWFQGGTATSNQRAALQVNRANGSFEGWTFDDNNWAPWLHVDRFTRNVGIGTTTPSARLHVFGGDLLMQAANNDAGDLVFQTNASTQLARIWTEPSGSSVLYLSSGDNLADITIAASGNVGVGTTSPGASLDVKSGGTPHLYLSTSRTLGTSRNWGIASNWNTEGDFAIFESTTNVNAPSTTRFNIDVNGNVGIGINLSGATNPNNYKLAVNGTIGAKAIKVETATTPWPDFVFEKNYTLKTIPELEAFINTNKHLPNVPSACEVEEKGIDIANMDATLLAKIEELSLYIIEQNKKLEEQNKELKVQNARIEALEKSK